MSKINADQLAAIQQFACEFARQDHSGHGVDHLNRVAAMIRTISAQEPVDESVALAAGWLHDVIDDKLTDDPASRQQAVIDQLIQVGIDHETQATIMAIMTNMSFAKSLGAHAQPLSLEGQVVQDADRLDAIGALGIGRAFYYSGRFGEEMYDPAKKPRLNMTKEQYRHEPGTTINHFYEKLFKIADQLNTPTARRIGQHRQQLMADFVASFKQEWRGE